MKAAGAALFVFPIRLFFQKNRLARKFSIKTARNFQKSLAVFYWRCLLVKIRTFFDENPDCEL